ncbi:hypothetical protein CTA1_9351 [Colletotrichum tanaceti]|uniref:Uncharacterized protein n=1 Tax=Colletotrichum tanaceti TaxID=1306861 RepID=A0A4U6XRZ2_9PEZI|nr:hypothetical protein CTA1_9351 [Colletotrichum tanaceti]
MVAVLERAVARREDNRGVIKAGDDVAGLEASSCVDGAAAFGTAFGATDFDAVVGMHCGAVFQ